MSDVAVLGDPPGNACTYVQKGKSKCHFITARILVSSKFIENEK